MWGKILRWFGIAGVVTLSGGLAVAATARQQADIYTVHALVSDNASVPAPETDTSLVNGCSYS